MSTELIKYLKINLFEGKFGNVTKNTKISI